jgi:hypothetical protein
MRTVRVSATPGPAGRELPLRLADKEGWFGRYMSPERLNGSVYTWAADVWSAGIIMLEVHARACGFVTAASEVVVQLIGSRRAPAS